MTNDELHLATIRTLTAVIDDLAEQLQAQRRESSLICLAPRIVDILSAFYLAPVSVSSLQPVLDLAVELNPALALQRAGWDQRAAMSPRASAHLCGRDPAAGWTCEQHRAVTR